MPEASQHPIFTRLRALHGPRPLVAGHRGSSSTHPENTVAAMRAAAAAGVAIQEFDVRELGDGALVCVHDATFDRTTDAARVLGPGAPVAQLDLATARRLDAGACRGPRFAGERVPTLEEALVAIGPDAVPLIEHKAGAAERYAAELRRLARTGDVILQSFDWRFLLRVRELAPEIALGALGPNPAFPHLDTAALRQIAALDVGLVHWRAADLGRDNVRRCHDAGYLVCSYTTDDELGWLGGRAIGLDAMCTNDPAGMRDALARAAD